MFFRLPSDSAIYVLCNSFINSMTDFMFILYAMLFAATYGILSTFLKVSDSAGKQEEVIIMNG